MAQMTARHVLQINPQKHVLVQNSFLIVFITMKNVYIVKDIYSPKRNISKLKNQAKAQHARQSPTKT